MNLKQALKALVDGKMIGSPEWQPCEFIKLSKDGTRIESDDDENISFSGIFSETTTFEIFDEDKELKAVIKNLEEEIKIISRKYNKQLKELEKVLNDSKKSLKKSKK